MFHLLFPACKQVGANYSNGSTEMTRKEKKNLPSLLFTEDRLLECVKLRKGKLPQKLGLS